MCKYKIIRASTSYNKRAIEYRSSIVINDAVAIRKQNKAFTVFTLSAYYVRRCSYWRTNFIWLRIMYVAWLTRIFWYSFWRMTENCITDTILFIFFVKNELCMTTNIMWILYSFWRMRLCVTKTSICLIFFLKKRSFVWLRLQYVFFYSFWKWWASYVKKAFVISFGILLHPWPFKNLFFFSNFVIVIFWE